ncbi:ABC transporter ATP-binding protein [Bacillus sp. UNC41MFS5]|uniref:ABC transporter ATP-binding protein n=1 Tax=Bacillus sp. UNC41MFS5 TaxID=1449046 RepID=UPI00047B5F65|nr:ABC transporter ATP-binding protein [Bacillus sp. UNC41MFS5]
MLNVNNLHVSYGAIKALRGVSIEVNRGECVAIVGSNGAGKTTLLKTICGLLTPNQGTVELDGKPLVGKKAYDIANLAVAHVPEGRRVFTEMSVLDNLILGSYVKEAKAHRNESLDYVFSLFPRLAERKNQLAGTMSGGEQQMLAVARGLMLKPKLIILDEPSSGLSPLIVEQMYEKLAEIHKTTDMAMLVVEQNVPIALSIANRGYVLENGSIHVAGTSNQLMVDPEVKAAYLGFH